jgi:hypothetical protein
VEINLSIPVSLWALTALFAARVAGQALQRWTPQPFLPPADAFQGSNLPYPALLFAQLVILAVMIAVAWRVQRGVMARNPGAGRVLGWLGAAYMAFALGRIAIGLSMPGAPDWFRTWIPAFFHVVLAGYVLTVSLYHRGKPAS